MLKTSGLGTNNLDFDHSLHFVVSDLGLHGLLRPVSLNIQGKGGIFCSDNFCQSCFWWEINLLKRYTHLFLLLLLSFVAVV